MLAALGRIALRHGQLDNAMKMVIKDLADVTQEEALHATAKQMSGQLRERIRTLAKQRLGEGRALVRLEAILERAQQATTRRNKWFHGTWGTETPSATQARRVVMRDARHSFQKAPTVKELTNLVDDLETILEDLLNARQGFLSNALKKSPTRTPFIARFFCHHQTVNVHVTLPNYLRRQTI